MPLTYRASWSTLCRLEDRSQHMMQTESSHDSSCYLFNTVVRRKSGNRLGWKAEALQRQRAHSKLDIAMKGLKFTRFAERRFKVF